jgi:polar amino acid transport system substrate-binding protein
MATMGVGTAGRVLLHGVSLAAIAAVALATDLDAAKRDLAPTGRLRVGIVSAPKASAFFAVEDADGRPRGVTVDLGEELARTLGVASEFFIAHNSGEITDALEKRLVDVAFLPVDDDRRKRVEFGPAYVRFESTCLVLGSSGFRTIAELDRPGTRVGAESNTTTLRAAARALKSATVIAVPSVAQAIDMLRSGRIDAFALGREGLVPYQAEIPGSLILDGNFHRTGIAIAVPKNHPAALAHARAFLEEAKASGLVRRALDKAGLLSAAVAPAE